MSTEDDSQTIAEALTRLQWKRGPGGPRGFGPPGGLGGAAGMFEGPGRGEHPFGGRGHSRGDEPGEDDGRHEGHRSRENDRRHGEHGRHEDGHDWRGKFGGRFGGRAQLKLLITLVQAGRALGVSAIGEKIGVDQPRASRLVSQGVELGLLQREADPDDARRTLIALTEKGQAISNRFRGAQRQTVDHALEEFSDEERALLARLLSRLADAWPN